MGDPYSALRIVYRKNLMQKVLAFIRLSRPTFLAGGMVLYALGAAVARYEGVVLTWGVYWTGQAGVTAVQLMTHYLNEFWDFEADRLNRNRTFWSGGSGVLPQGLLSPQTALFAAMICAGVAVVVLGVLVRNYHPGTTGILIFALAFLGAFFYSTPPARLAASGYGELTTSVIVAGLVPMFSYQLQSGRLSDLVLLASLPLILLSFAMLLAFEFPDHLADEAAGKRTLVVRLGARAGRGIHNSLLVATYLALGMSVLMGLPTRIVLGALIPLPLAIFQAWLLWQIARGAPIAWSRLTFGATALYALTAYMLAFGFWSLG